MELQPISDHSIFDFMSKYFWKNLGSLAFMSKFLNIFCEKIWPFWNWVFGESELFIAEWEPVRASVSRKPNFQSDKMCENYPVSLPPILFFDHFF